MVSFCQVEACSVTLYLTVFYYYSKKSLSKGEHMLKWLLYKPALNSRSTSNKVMLGKSFSNVKTDSTSHSSADTIAKLGLIGKITYVNNLLVPILLASQIAAFLKQQYLKNIFVNWHGYMHTDTNSENLEGDNFFFDKNSSQWIKWVN